MEDKKRKESDSNPTSLITEVGDLGLGVEELSDSDKEKLEGKIDNH